MNDVTKHFKMMEYQEKLATLSSKKTRLEVISKALEKELVMASKSFAMGLCTQLNIEHEAETIAALFNMHQVTNLIVVRNWVITHLVEIGYPYQDTDLRSMSVLLKVELNKRLLDLH